MTRQEYRRLAVTLFLSVCTCALLGLVSGEDEDKEDTQFTRNRTSHPEQLHLSLGTDETEMLITWNTLLPLNDVAHVEYGLAEDKLTSQAAAEVTHLTDETDLYTYRALMTGLKPHTVYYYRVGSKASSWSNVTRFRTLPSGPNWNPRFAIYGDLGFEHEESIPFLTKDVVDRDMYDVIFHIGDFAYNLNERNGSQGDDFMNSIQKVSSRVPYMGCPGNHENYNNFSHYDARFSMIGDRSAPKHGAPLTSRLNNHFHSMDIGPAHIIMFSTEFYFYTKYGWDQIERQWHWLEEDLKRANANRAQRPWIIVMGHRSFYCLRYDKCNMEAMEREQIRTGIEMHKKGEPKFGLEDLFFKYGVDIQFYGHEHLYARSMPVYNHTVMTSGHSPTNPYDNPKGPLIIVTGSAGNRELHSFFNPQVKTSKWIGAHAQDYGYTRFTFKDREHIVVEQTSDEKGGQTIDHIEIVKQSDHPKWMF